MHGETRPPDTFPDSQKEKRIYSLEKLNRRECGFRHTAHRGGKRLGSKWGDTMKVSVSDFKVPPPLPQILLLSCLCSVCFWAYARAPTPALDKRQGGFALETLNCAKDLQVLTLGVGWFPHAISLERAHQGKVSASCTDRHRQFQPDFQCLTLK